MFGGPGKLGFVDVLACHQTIGMTGNGWYRGSADAVRRNIDSILDPHFGGDLPTDLLIISGTGVYNMVRHMLRES
jgi:ADP-glucose pyrophosphorylase